MPSQQHEPDAPAEHLLVHAHELERRARRRCAARVDRQAGALRAASRDALDVGGVQPAEPLRQVRGQQHARPDGLAVQPVAVAGRGLDRVAEGVAEVEQRAPPVLALVRRDDLGLDLAGARTACVSAAGSRASSVVDIRLEPVEETPRRR